MDDYQTNEAIEETTKKIFFKDNGISYYSHYWNQIAHAFGTGKTEQDLRIKQKVKAYKPSTVLLENSKYTAQELKTWYKGYLREVGLEGKLYKRDFIDIYKGIVPRGDPTKLAGMLFDMVDEDSSGYLDFEEFIGAMSVTSSKSKKEKLEWTFKIFDKDNSGSICIDELTHMLVATYGMNDLVEHSLDYGEKELTEDEETIKKKARQAAEGIMKQYDTDGSGEIDKEEFIEGCMHDDRVMKVMNIFGEMVQ